MQHGDLPLPRNAIVNQTASDRFLINSNLATGIRERCSSRILESTSAARSKRARCTQRVSSAALGSAIRSGGGRINRTAIITERVLARDLFNSRCGITRWILSRPSSVISRWPDCCSVTLLIVTLCGSLANQLTDLLRCPPSGIGHRRQSAINQRAESFVSRRDNMELESKRDCEGSASTLCRKSFLRMELVSAM
jgi:hypothetical protein